MTDSEENYDLVPTHLAITAMRDNGYRNTAYALAELIDNSIQASATLVELLCCEAEEFVRQRTMTRIKEIAVLDNGSGMDPALLRIALQFGNGTHLTDHSGIGRFGMGLPSASISQCSRVEVWSWQDGPENAYHSLIDLGRVKNREMRGVPEPQLRPLPDQWLQAASSIGETGTLVVWSKLDRVIWRTARSIIKNSEFLIARMYRKFLQDNSVKIRMASFLEDSPGSLRSEDYALPNDPNYLIAPSSTPEPYGNTPMFKQDGDRWEVVEKIRLNGEEHSVTTRFSYAREEARADIRNAGSTPYGQHAGRNVGISVVRAGRELDMDQSLVISYDPTERWWGIEVEFQPGLDDIFGVTNNKQAARNFSELAANFKSIISEDSKAPTRAEIDELHEDGDPQAVMMDLIRNINNRLKQIRRMIEVQKKGTVSTGGRHGRNSPEHRATQATDERKEEGRTGRSDADEGRPTEERKQELKQDLIETGFSEEQAEELAASTIASGVKYAFRKADIEGRAFFTVRPVAGEIVVKININHPAYKNLVGVLDEEPDKNESSEQLRTRLMRANDGLKLLLMAWARYEDEAMTDAKRIELQDIRQDWGRVAYRFLESDK